jgi:hypothetical protein
MNTKMAKTNPSDNDKIDPRLCEISAQSKVLLELTNFSSNKLTALIPRAHQPAFEGAAAETLSTEETVNAEHLIQLVAGICKDSQQQQEEEGEGEEGKEDNSEEAALLDTLQDSLERRVTENPVHGNADKFITYFSRINIAWNWTLAHMSDERLAREIATFVPMGNSRDPPTRFLFPCPHQALGCKYSSPNRELLKRHAMACQPQPENLSIAPPTLYKCRTQGCMAGPFDTVHKRDYHKREKHKWTRKQCNLGCTNGVWYKAHHSWNTHKIRIHGDNWDKNTTCSFPDCP